MYAQRRTDAPIPPSNYSGNAFRYPPPTPVPPLSRDAGGAEALGGEARGRALEAGESLRVAVPSEHRAVREVRAGAGDAVSMGGVAGLALDDGAAMGAGEGAMDAGTDAPSGAALHFSFGAWKDIFGGIGNVQRIYSIHISTALVCREMMPN